MSTIKELIYDVREVLNQYADDSNLSDRYILHLWNLKRSKYLRNDLNNLQKTTDISTTQTLCLEVEEVSAEQCGINYSCDTILRTVKPIPKPLELNLNPAIISVKSILRLDKPFNFVTKAKALYSNNAPFKNGVYVFLDDDLRLYFVSGMSELKAFLECITVTAIFENPDELKNYFNCCNCETPAQCFDDDIDQYPIPAHHIDSIRNEIVELLLNKFKFPEDKVNDGDSTTV